MASLHPVLWTKGTLLTPQHLQAQDRYVDELVRLQLGALTFCPWGLSRIELDRAALAGGSLIVRSVAGRLPDGLLFDAPAADPTPPPRSLAELWRPGQETLLVSIAVPEYRPGARNVASRSTLDAGGATTRWRAADHAAHDETTGLPAEHPIQLAHANLRLLFEGESAEGYVTLPVARLLRGKTGEISLDPAFVPPLLDTAASGTLTGIAKRVVDRATAKANALADTRRQRNRGLADFSITDVGSFWLLYTLNTSVPPVRHLAEVRRGHPSDLWEAMVGFAGALTTFAPTPRVLPAYDHTRLGECFAALERLLLELLDTAVPETVVSLPLEPVAPSVKAVELGERSWLDAPQWFLAVSPPRRREDGAPMGQAEVIARVLHGFKIVSADVISNFIRNQISGLTLTHVPQPPPGVPVKLDYLYFAVNREGPAWAPVVSRRNLAVYSADLPDARLELVVLLR